MFPTAGVTETEVGRLEDGRLREHNERNIVVLAETSGVGDCRVECSAATLGGQNAVGVLSGGYRVHRNDHRNDGSGDCNGSETGAERILSYHRSGVRVPVPAGRDCIRKRRQGADGVLWTDLVTHRIARRLYGRISLEFRTQLLS